MYKLHRRQQKHTGGSDGDANRDKCNDNEPDSDPELDYAVYTGEEEALADDDSRMLMELDYPTHLDVLTEMARQLANPQPMPLLVPRVRSSQQKLIDTLRQQLINSLKQKRTN